MLALEVPGPPFVPCAGLVGGVFPVPPTYPLIPPDPPPEPPLAPGRLEGEQLAKPLPPPPPPAEVIVENVEATPSPPLGNGETTG